MLYPKGWIPKKDRMYINDVYIKDMYIKSMFIGVYVHKRCIHTSVCT